MSLTGRLAIGSFLIQLSFILCSYIINGRGPLKFSLFQIQVNGPKNVKIKPMPSISIAEPVSELRRIKIVENGEPLVDFLKTCPKLVMDRPRFAYRRETVVRKSVAEKLCQAAESLPNGYRLAIIEGWRAPLIQRRMYRFAWNRFKDRHPEWSDVTLRRVVNRYTAPMNDRVPPPHTTGAAVDLSLHDENGSSLDMCSPYNNHDPKCFALHVPNLSATATLHRKILSEAVIAAGLTNYPSEYWHYSYGDQGWAYRGSHERAIYSAVTPEGWQPDEADVIDGPLVYVEGEVAIP
jgi:zinc D-Ala-D-Ala dipeptidase